MEIEVHVHNLGRTMVDEVDETVRAAFAGTYNKGYADGYAAGIAAALVQIQSLATENGVPTSSSEPSMDLSINRLNLSTRTYNALYREEIRTVDDIYVFHGKPKGLMNIQNFGQGGIAEINTKLVELGYPELRKVSKY
jgi:DNA-directed RNA polymerase alpha subunit